MKTARCITISLVMVLLATGIALSQEPIVFPAEGQSEEQMEKDKYACYSWAKKQSGFDPMKVPKVTTPPPEQQAGRGGVVKGAAAGAAVGYTTRRILTGKSGRKGAEAGAVAGGLLGGLRQSSQRRADEQAQQQWADQQAAQYAQNRNSYNRAYSACLEGKGYTVK